MDSLVGLPQLCIGFSTLEQYIGIAEHDAVHRTGPVRALDEVFADQGRVYILLQRYVISVQAIATAPDTGLLHHVILIEHIRQSGDTHCEEQSRITVVGSTVVVFLIERIDQWQSVGTRTIGIDEVLRRFVEVATTIGSTGDVWRDQSVAPVEVTIGRTVVA